MKKLSKIFIVLIVIIFTQCVATKRQKDNFLSKYCERKDSLVVIKKDSVVYKDSLIYIPTVVNTPIYLENPCKLLCDSLGNLKHFSKTTTKGGLKSTVKSVGNVLVVECETDSLKARVQWLEHRITLDKYSHTENTVKKICELEHRNKFDGFTFWWFWITFSILFIIAAIKIIKLYFHI